MNNLRSRLGVNVHQGNAHMLQLAASLGVSVVRCDANWYDLQPSPTTWTWEWLDTLVQTAQSLGLTVYPSLGKTPSWLDPNPGELPPLDDWTRFCRTFAQHFKGRLRFVGCWNEYQGSASDYIQRLLAPMVDAFKSTDPNYQICGPECDTAGAWDSWLRTFLKEGRSLVDVLTIHAYGATGAKTWEKIAVPKAWWHIWRKPSILQVCDSVGYDRPIWITETGIQSATAGDSGQARYWDELLERFQSETRPAGLLIYALIDEPTNTWGMFDQRGQPKEVFRVIQRYASPGVV